MSFHKTDKLKKAIEAFNARAEGYKACEAYLAHRVARDYESYQEELLKELRFDDDDHKLTFTLKVIRNRNEQLNILFPVGLEKERLTSHNVIARTTDYIEEEGLSLADNEIHRFGDVPNIGKTNVGDSDTGPQIIITINNELLKELALRKGVDFVSHETATTAELEAADRITINWASLWRLRHSDLTRFKTVYLDEIHKVLIDSVMSKYHQGIGPQAEQNEWVFQKLIKQNKVIAGGGYLSEYELSFWERFGKPFNYYSYRPKKGIGRTVYRCQAESQLYDHAVQWFKEGEKIIWGTELSGSIHSIEKELKKKVPNARILTINKNNKDQIPKWLTDKEAVNDDIDILIMSPVCPYGLDVNNKFSRMISHHPVGSKPTTGELQYQQGYRERHWLEAAVFACPGGVANEYDISNTQVTNTYDLDDPITGVSRKDPYGRGERHAWAKEITMGGKGSKVLQVFHYYEKSGHPILDSPYPIRRLKGSSLNWRNKVLSAQRLSPSQRILKQGTDEQKELEACCKYWKIEYPNKPDNDQYDFRANGGFENRRRGKYLLDLTLEEIEKMKAAVEQRTNNEAELAEVLQDFIRQLKLMMNEKGIAEIPNSVLVGMPIWDRITSDSFLSLLKVSLMEDVANQKSRNGTSYIPNKPYLWIPKFLSNFGIYAKSEKHEKGRRGLVKEELKVLEGALAEQYEAFKKWHNKRDPYSQLRFSQFLDDYFNTTSVANYPEHLKPYFLKVLANWDQEILIVHCEEMKQSLQNDRTTIR
jgi:hypothetical protein